MYCSGFIYRAAMHLLHGPSLGKKYEYICSFISPGDRVLDVGCGTGTLQSHLKGNQYLGLEMNDDFIAYAKNKGRNVVKQDVLKFNRFKDFDVCVMMDVLHHVNPGHAQLMKKALSGVGKTVIISEPYDIRNKPELLKKIECLLDADGINGTDAWMDKKSLIRFYEKYHPKHIREIGQTIIAVYQKKGATKRKGAKSSQHIRKPPVNMRKSPKKA